LATPSGRLALVPSVPCRNAVDAAVVLTIFSFVDQPLFGLLLKFGRIQYNDRCFLREIRESHHQMDWDCSQGDDEPQQ
jgi:hypothetical protein